jgi:hypothetical protein
MNFKIVKENITRWQHKHEVLVTVNEKTNQLNPWCRVFLQKLIVTQLVKEFLAFLEPESPLPWPVRPTIRP